MSRTRSSDMRGMLKSKRANSRLLDTNIDRISVKAINKEIVPQLDISKKEIMIDIEYPKTERKTPRPVALFIEPRTERPLRKLEALIGVSGMHGNRSMELSNNGKRQLGLSGISYCAAFEPISALIPVKSNLRRDVYVKSNTNSPLKKKLLERQPKDLKAFNVCSKKVISIKSPKKSSPKPLKHFTNLEKVSEYRQKEIDKYMRKVTNLKSLIVSSIENLDCDLLQIEKSDFSILTSDHAKRFDDAKVGYFVIDVEMLQSVINDIDEIWFEDTGIMRQSHKNQFNVCMPDSNRALHDHNDIVRHRQLDDTNDIWLCQASIRLHGDALMHTNTTWTSRANCDKSKFDDMYETLYGTDFEVDVDRHAVQSPGTDRSAMHIQYRPPVGKSKIDSKQCKQRKNKNYADYTYRPQDSLIEIIKLKTMEYVNFSLNPTISVLLLLHAAKHLMHHKEHTHSLHMLILALNMSLLFDISQLSAWAYKHIGDYYSAIRIYDIAQLSYTRSLMHGMRTHDRIHSTRMYDSIGSI